MQWAGLCHGGRFEGLSGGPFCVVLDSSVWRALDTLRGRDLLFFPSLAVAAWAKHVMGTTHCVLYAMW